MFVIIADQVGSRHDRDRVAEALTRIHDRFGNELALPAERTAGDELQALTARADCALAVLLELLRGGRFRAGMGVGQVTTPLPASIREASGPAFIAGRRAIERAARSSIRFAAIGSGSAASAVSDIDALIALLVTQRARWSEQAWELYDLREDGHTQASAANELGVTPQAVSKRARTAGLAVDAAARAAIARVMTAADVDREP